MTPNPVGALANEPAPQRSPPQSTGSGDNFAQLVQHGGTSHSDGHKQTGHTDKNSVQNRVKSRTKSDDPNAAAAATTPPQVLPAITAATANGETQVAAPTAPSAPSPQQEAASALAATANEAAPAEKAGGTPATASNSGQGAALPPTASDLNARVVAAAPTYLSQPNSALAGLWHHTGAAAAGDPTGQPPGDAPAGDNPAAAPQAGASATLNAAQANAVPALPHVVTGVGIMTGDSSQHDPSTSALAGDPTSGAITGALPNATDTTPFQIQTAAPAAGLASTAPPILPAVEQVAVNLAQAVQNGTDRIEIQLKPASLGAIDVKLDLTHDGRITAVISADRSDTLNMLRQDAGTLQQALRDAGLQADAGSLSFNLRSDAQSYSSSNSRSAPSRTIAAIDRTASSAPQTELTRLRRHHGALDIAV